MPPCLGGWLPPAGPNARGEPRPEAGAERTLEGVGSTARLGETLCVMRV